MGDSTRVKYVLACLVKNTIERNKKREELGLIQIKTSISHDEEITLFEQDTPSKV